MLLITHIIAALLGILLATFAAIVPSQRTLRLAGVCTGVTLVSGVGLVWTMHASLVSVCESGVLYLAVVGLLMATAEYRLKTLAR